MELAVNSLLSGYDAWDILPLTEVWILGKKYEDEDLVLVEDKINSIMLMTYRKGFQPISGQSTDRYTSDRGFGCMIRASQMLIAETLKRLSGLDREWTWTRETSDESYLKIVNQFEDTPEKPYSLHSLCCAGEKEYGKRIGDWFSPNEICQILKKLVSNDESKFSIHVAMDCQLCPEDFALDNTSSKFKPTLIIIPLRLGIGEINPVYINSLKKCLELETSCGIIGGRPNEALYFFGYAGEELLFHDPHQVQMSGRVGNKETEAEIEQDSTYHKSSPGRMQFTSMDPSIAVSFFCQKKEDLDSLIAQLQNIAGEEKNPIFEIVKTRSIPWKLESASSLKRDLEHDLDIICDGDPLAQPDDDSDDDFEIIV